MKTQNCLIYGRLSVGDAALESHEDRNLKYAALHQLDIKGNYRDEDTSGSIPMIEREGGRAVMNRLKLGDVGNLIVAKLDRLGRRARDILGTLEELDRMGVALHIVDFGGDTITTRSHIGRLLLTLFAGMAEWELNEIRDRTQKRMDHMRSKGELTGTIPYGYNGVYAFADGSNIVRDMVFSVQELAVQKSQHGECLSKRLVVNAVEQSHLVRMAAWRQSGRTLQAIADALNASGIPSKSGGLWQCGNVDGVLKSKYTLELLQASVAEAA